MHVQIRVGWVNGSYQICRVFRDYLLRAVDIDRAKYQRVMIVAD
jgi:hypothetical protein